MNASPILWFDDISMDDVPLVGGKNASLGEMRRSLAPQGISIPDGFAVTAGAYRYFLDSADLVETLADELRDLDVRDLPRLRAAGHRIRSAILGAEVPADLREAVSVAYGRLEAEYGRGCDVAVRSSATAEDLPDASFAGQQESYLNVRGERQLIEAVRRCFASLFTDRAIVYRVERGFAHADVALSVGVQKMVRSDLAGAGVLFTLDTESGFRDVVLINAAYGLGESVVQGTVNPDEYVVFKPTLAQGYRPVIRRSLGTKEFKLVYDEGGSRQTRSVPVTDEARGRWVLSEDEILTLARWGVLIEQHYSRRHGVPLPMDIEWAKDGTTGQLFIVQARPETVHARGSGTVLERHHLDSSGPILARGRSVGEGIGDGAARVIHSAADLEELCAGEVLITGMTDPDWEPVLSRAAAIVTDRGGRTCHAAIISRELGLPAIVGTGDATKRVATGSDVTVSCAEGEEGRVYEGRLAHHIERIDLTGIERPRTRILVNIGNPAEAFRTALLPTDGVGLARLEFIIGSHIGIHPMALAHPERITDRAVLRKIEARTRGYADPRDFFVERLAEGCAMIAAAYHPRQVIVRLSDFKSNEYAGLLGGSFFEPHEENPMIGFRGATRYYNEHYRDGFALECRALHRVRGRMGLKNVALMVPFCRTPDEGRKVLEVMAEHGLIRGEDGLQVYVMCELPSNVVLAEEFAQVFDGFSIGSNDLTQLVLGADRDSELLAHVFDERNEAVKRMITQVIGSARMAECSVGICGQAPSDYPEFAAFLVEAGIDSISLNPDAVLATTLTVLETEWRLAAPPNIEELCVDLQC